ncbi:HNH endonuclease signature motif containing protein [Herbaspirillum camelliae]|uniref:HNH endonuclease signature motif containing protein n=1 Tax=Herbaspirillum camelliae TaxID=1892903 RepID=UPI001E3CC90B|nr:HNH endonuclease signature motif containing protein [Herbaspirillum camelliae]
MSGASNRKPDPEKRCTICGCRLARKRNQSGRLEDMTSFLRRNFCSLSCANSRSKGGLSRKAFHAQARKQRKESCEACGTKTRLHVHHLDEDWTNNDPSNLQTLCVFCHQYWHATHRRLGLKPSQPMPKLVFHSGPTASTESVAYEDSAMQSMPSKRRSSSK